MNSGLLLIFIGLVMLLLESKLSKIIGLIGSFVALLMIIFMKEQMGYDFSTGLPYGIRLISKVGSQTSYVFLIAIGIMVFLANIYSLSSENKGERAAASIYAGGAMSMLMAADWISGIFSWELMAISSAYLVWCGRSLKARRATFRYILYHFLSGNLFLAGGLINWYKTGIIMENLTGDFSIGSLFLMASILINCGMIPFGNWLPDGYSAATQYGNLFMATCTTKVSAAMLIYFFSGDSILIYFGGILAIYGAVMALMENHIRKLLAYHIISQLGMIIAATGVGSFVGNEGAALHGAFNIMFKGVLIMCAGGVFMATGEEKLSNIQGRALWRAMPFVWVCFAISSAAIAGIPPLNGFVSKGLILESLKEGGFTFGYVAVLMAGVGTCLSITFKINWFGFIKKEEGKKCFKGCNLPFNVYLAAGIGTLLCLITGLFPQLSMGLLLGDNQSHVYTAEHILEYAGLVPGALAGFYVLRKVLKPHDTITLDFDWIFRKAFRNAVFYTSKILAEVFDFAGRLSIKSARGLNDLIYVPEALLGRESFEEKSVRVKTGVSRREKIMPLGNIVDALIVCFIIGFIVVSFIEGN